MLCFFFCPRSFKLLRPHAINFRSMVYNYVHSSLRTILTVHPGETMSPQPKSLTGRTGNTMFGEDFQVF